jgi:TRAP-type mannitol/chloroaromatic compound transport system permease large subunit
MSVAAIGMLGVAFLLLLIFLRVPIAVALAASGLLGYAAIDGWTPALRMFGLVPYQLASAYSLSVIPLFILMGAVAARGNMASELFQACNAVFSGVRGALANATIGACACSARSAARRSRPPPPSPRSRSRKCAGTVTTPRSRPAPSPQPGRSTC